MTGLSLLIGAFLALQQPVTLRNPGVLLAPLCPQLGSPVPSRWAPQSQGHCPFNSSPGRSRALLRAARARPPACARPSVLRPSLPPQLALPRRAPAAGAAPAAAPGRESAARRPGTRQGAGAAPNRPRFFPSSVSRFSESCPFILCRVAPGALPRRGFPPRPQLVWPGPKCRMGLPLRGPVAARTDTAPLVWGQDDS